MSISITLLWFSVPLGETSIKFENYLTSTSTPVLSAPPPPTEEGQSQSQTWACSECTFNNHLDLESCEICEMPRISLG